MSYAVKYKTNKGEEEMKKRRVAKLVALSMVAATLLTGVNVQASMIHWCVMEKMEKLNRHWQNLGISVKMAQPIRFI